MAQCGPRHPTSHAHTPPAWHTPWPEQPTGHSSSLTEQSSSARHPRGQWHRGAAASRAATPAAAARASAAAAVDSATSAAVAAASAARRIRIAMAIATSAAAALAFAEGSGPQTPRPEHALWHGEGVAHVAPQWPASHTHAPSSVHRPCPEQPSSQDTPQSSPPKPASHTQPPSWQKPWPEHAAGHAGATERAIAHVGPPKPSWHWQALALCCIFRAQWPLREDSTRISRRWLK